MGIFWNDTKHSLQVFWKSPGFAIAAIIALALGIGANSAIFSVVNAVLLKPLNYPHAERMVNFLVPSAETASDLHNIPQFHFLRRQTKLLKEVVALTTRGPALT